VTGVRGAEDRSGARTHRSPDLTAAYRLTALAAVALAVVSAGGVLDSGWLYRDNPLVVATFRGQDLVTLAVAVPLLVAGLVLESRGSVRGRVLWLAMLFYAFYGYVFYLYGAAFNPFFLLYVAIVALSLYALLASVPRLTWDPEVVEPRGRRARAARVVGVAYLLLVATGLGLLWTGMSAGYLLTGVVPAPILASGHPTGVVFATDLVFIVPPMVIGAVGLIRRTAIGALVAVVMCLNGTIYTLSLAAASVAVRILGAGSGDEFPLWAVLTLLGAVATVLLLPGGRPSAAAAAPAR